ncbi:hypothetical protein HHK36_005375 [Tetracentron sinense]|uniref:AB hydrolase-1 domain-containing protein n=1 Tax=Tetracentron sinense TaxID=13715 RepID=A0A834ZLB9_TETSI|nr:hypothetical protein HHK36_005375 [Tetracentron sinense]
MIKQFNSYSFYPLENLCLLGDFCSAYHLEDNNHLKCGKTEQDKAPNQSMETLKLHVVEVGTGSSVVAFLQWFPEILYSSRHQMIAVANSRFQALGLNCRGLGLSELPLEPEKATFSDLVEDLWAIFDSFSILKVFIIGKDFGARPACRFALLHPEKGFRSHDTKSAFPPYSRIMKSWGFMHSWLEDYGVTDPKVQVPALLIIGEKDYALQFNSWYITSGMVNEYVPDLKITYLPEGTHFIQEQFPDQVNQLIFTFLNKHT